MGDLDFFYVHTVTVETLSGVGAQGEIYAAPATVHGFLEGKVQMVRSATGEQVVSQSTFYCSTTDGARFTPESKVTAGGRVSHVITQNINDAPGLDLPDHAAVYLQ